MFQPGEEGFDGASHMIREGVLDAAGRRVDAAYGMHVFSALEPHGTFCTKPGVMLSSSDGLTVTVLGAGGHGSAPHSAKDPVTAAAEMVTALQVMVTRQFNMFDPVVLSVGVLQAGTKRNIIPETARIEATIRTFSEASRQKMMDAVPRLLKGIAAAHGLDVDVNYQQEYPLTITDEDETHTAENVIEELFGDSRLARWATPLSGSEDFSQGPRRGPRHVHRAERRPPRTPTTPLRRSTTPRTPRSTTACWPTAPRSTRSSPSPGSPRLLQRTSPARATQSPPPPFPSPIP